MTDRGIYSYYNIVTGFGWPNDFLPHPRAEFSLPPHPRSELRFTIFLPHQRAEFTFNGPPSDCGRSAPVHQLGMTLTKVFDDTTKNQLLCYNVLPIWHIPSFVKPHSLILPALECCHHNIYIIVPKSKHTFMGINVGVWRQAVHRNNKGHCGTPSHIVGTCFLCIYLSSKLVFDQLYMWIWQF